MPITVKPLTTATWSDFEALFGERGACGGCWCTWWHQGRAEWTRNKGARNKRRMKAMVEAGEVPGLLAYRGDVAVGWCSVMPRESYAALRRSRMLNKVDPAPAWSVPCFFIASTHRRSGVAVELLRAAARYARSRGATLLEGYPVIARKGTMPDAFAWTGLLPIFERAGFKECARPSATRAVVRLELGQAGLVNR